MIPLDNRYPRFYKAVQTEIPTYYRTRAPIHNDSAATLMLQLIEYRRVRVRERLLRCIQILPERQSMGLYNRE